MKKYLPYGIQLDDVNQYDIGRISGSNRKVRTYWESECARKNLKKLPKSNLPVKIILVCEWSDGCDPNGRNKGNRGSVHIISVSLLSTKNKNSIKNTFVLGISKDKTDHEHVRRLIYEDIKQLENATVFYDGNQKVRLQVINHVSIQDRPERGECTGFGSHNGTYSMRFGHVCPISETLPSCKDCHLRRRKTCNSAKSNNECESCYDWGMEEVEFLTKNYNEIFPDVDINGYMKSRKVTVKSMKEAAQIASCKLHNKEWNVGTTRTFLKLNGFNGNLEDDIIENAKTEHPKSIQKILPAKMENEDSFEYHIEAIMHLLFLGVTETVMSVLQRMLKLHGKYATFHNGISVLRDLRNLRIDWLKAWPFGSQKTPFGPYVSENCAAFCRSMKSVYSVLDETLLNKKTEDSEEHIQKSRFLISSWLAVVSRVMQDTVTYSSIDDTERHIKIFLSAFHELDIDLLNVGAADDNNDKKIKPKVQTTANLSCLLNIPDIMRRFGPPRLYWEGSFRGEGILGKVKEIFTQGTHMPWFATTALEKFYNERSLELLLENESESDMDKQHKIKGYADYYTYKSIEILEVEIGMGKPVSAVKMKDGKLFCSVWKNLKRELVGLQPLDGNGIVKDATWFAPVNITHERRNIIESEDTEGVVFLPHMTNGLMEINKSTKGRYYCAIDENWLERQKIGDGKYDFRLPKVCGVKYN